MRALASAASAVLAVGGLVASCTPIEPKPLSQAPINACPCDDYDPGTRLRPTCRAGRCEVPSAGDRPTYPFWIVVHVPESSIFAPGSTYVMFSDEKGEPAFKQDTRPGIVLRCVPPQCLQVGDLSSVSGEYRTNRQASIDVGYPFASDQTLIPVRAEYLPTGNVQRATFDAALPLDRLFASSRLVSSEIQGVVVQQAVFARALPFGNYQRVMYPQPPFDAFFPPIVDEQRVASATFIDRVSLGITLDPFTGVEGGLPLDDVAGTSRIAEASRAAGLDGFRLWLRDLRTSRRISVIKTLTGTTATVRLDTAGERTSSAAFRSEVEAVLAPPASWVAIPSLVTELPNGSGLRNLSYPAIPPPVVVTGVVALGGDGGTLNGFPAEITFESEELLTLSDRDSRIRYSTTLNTDDRGRFSTVLPPGAYRATVEPAQGTGFAKTKMSVSVDRTVTALTLQPPKLTPVRGRAVLSDGRLLREADVLALPEEPANPLQMAKPRPARTTTGPDGRFSIDLDPGPYVFVVTPKAGTGFPKVATRKEIPATPTDLDDIRVPAPIRLAFTLRDPSSTANPIVRAVVRILAAFPGRESTPVEIGSAITEPDGSVEILLAQEPR